MVEPLCSDDRLVFYRRAVLYSCMAERPLKEGIGKPILHGDNRQLVISVVDSGVGLQPEHAEQVFDAFVSTRSQGTGRRLLISRSIIESHGGRWWATAPSGRGARFSSPYGENSRRIRLPNG
jgi:signal transduction histidine kinase